jgi:hypothetical protein
MCQISLLFNNSAKPFRNIEKGCIRVIPLSHRFAIGRETLQVFKRRLLPITGSENDWDNASIPAPMSLKSMLHLDSIMMVGSQKIGTDKEEDDVGRTDGLVDSLSTISSCEDLLVMPLLNKPITFELSQVGSKLITPFLVNRRVGVEDTDAFVIL